MKVDGKPYRSIWVAEDGVRVAIIDQTRLPHDFAIVRLATLADAVAAIRTMQVRGAPLIGATAAYGLALAMRETASDAGLEQALAALAASRPTAVNLAWALARMRAVLSALAPEQRVAAAYAEAARIADEDVAINRAIGGHGLALLEVAAAKAGSRRLNILTHCNAGWLATVDYGTALSPIYQAHDQGIALHVWVDETRPRNQGAGLTAWELGRHGVPHTVIVDNAGGHLMQHGQVDLCIVGTDRVSRRGDVCNKIGTYLKALAAADNGVPFYVAAPGPSIDWAIADGLAQIPIEERDPAEVTHIVGRDDTGRQIAVAVAPSGTAAANFGFDVTPARLVSGLITERGVAPATAEGLAGLYPETVRPLS